MDMQVELDTLWVMLAGFLVFFMNAGFGMLESGLARSKNTVNIISKNFVVFAIASIAYYALGFGIMFGNSNNFFGRHGLWFLNGLDLFGEHGLWFLNGLDNSPLTGDAYRGEYSALSWTGVPLNAKFFFQLVFAATAATIVSGAVAERIKYTAFLVFAVLLTLFIYPVVGHWIWGGGLLSSTGFHDFAGSTVVHSVGGWCALTGAWILGPRAGKYKKNGQVSPVPGHNLSSAFIGCLILWLGWFGFNPGSTMAANAEAIAHIALTTNLSAAAGTLSATFLAWFLLKKPDVTMTLNGALAGLVAITAPCAVVTPCAAIVIGALAGMLVVIAVLFFDKIRIDDPVGATSVHLVCGVFGTLAVALFGDPVTAQKIAGVDVVPGLWTQAKGVFTVGVFVFVSSALFWLAIKYTLGLRVSEEEEREGLDWGEHGNVAYPDFQPSSTLG